MLRLMVVHAHPDDECIATGGVLARYAAEGMQTILVMATGGEEGDIVLEELNTPEHKSRLGEIRAEELAQSVAILKVSVLEKLGFRDSGMVGSPANANPACFHMADKDEATGRIVKLIRQYQPHVLISYDERGGYWHPDHLACYLTTYAAFYAANDAERYPDTGEPWQPSKLYYTARSRNEMRRAWQMLRDAGIPNPMDNPDFPIAKFTSHDSRITTAIDVREYLAQKRDAIASHRTQIATSSPMLNMPEEAVRMFFGVEQFTLVDSFVTVPAHEGLEDDLFAGLR